MIKNEFSDRATISSFLSPPRKPSNLKIQDISSTSTESSGDSSDSSDSSDSEEQSVANGTKDLSMQSDPSTIIPFISKPKLVPFSKDKGPTFTIRKRDEPPKKLAIPTATGHRPLEPKVVEAVLRSWDKDLMFWTLDLNGTRYIVKPFRGAPLSGQKYQYWAGSDTGFEEKPLAFSHIDMEKMSDRYQKAFEAQHTDMPAKPENSNLSDRSRKRRRDGSASFLSDPEDHAALEIEASVPARERSSDVDPRFQAPLQSTDDNADPDTTTKSNKIKSALKQGKKPTRYSDLPPLMLFNTTGGPSHTSRKATAKKRRKTEKPSRELAGLQDFLTPALHPSATDRSESPEASIQNEQATAGTTKHRSNKKKKPTAPQALTDAPTLSLQRQHRSTILVRVAPSAEYQPLRLSACPNIRAFRDQVLDVWEADPDNVAKILVTFLWMDDNDKMRTMFLNPDHETCWNLLLEVVDEAPCWDEEKGRCVIDVEIVPLD